MMKQIMQTSLGDVTLTINDSETMHLASCITVNGVEINFTMIVAVYDGVWELKKTKDGRREYNNLYTSRVDDILKSVSFAARNKIETVMLQAVNAWSKENSHILLEADKESRIRKIESLRSERAELLVKVGLIDDEIKRLEDV